MSFAILPVSNDSNSKSLTRRISMSIYIRTPYFYIIEHKETKKQYAGAKWAVDALPENFMTDAGYQTSSRTVHKIIASEGIDVFLVKEIIKLEELLIPFGCQTIDEYESWFLETNNCCTSDMWYNMVPPWTAAIGTEEFYKNMLSKYGVRHPGQMDTHSQKVKATCNARYDKDSYFESEEAKTKLLEYIHEFDESAVNVWQLDHIKEKSKKTCLSNHGVEYPAQSPILFAKGRKTLLDNYGVDSPMKLPEFKDAHRNSCIESLGVDSPMKSKKVISKYKANFHEKYGVGFP